ERRAADALLPRAAQQPDHQHCLCRPAAGVGGDRGQGRLTILTVTALARPASSTTASRIRPAPSGVQMLLLSGRPLASQCSVPLPLAARATESCGSSSSRASGGG